MPSRQNVVEKGRPSTAERIGCGDFATGESGKRGGTGEKIRARRVEEQGSIKLDKSDRTRGIVYN